MAVEQGANELGAVASHRASCCMQVCRKSDGDCDLPEYCTGKDSKCPTNAYAPKTVVRHLPAARPSANLHRDAHHSTSWPGNLHAHAGHHVTTLTDPGDSK
jgi:hypothetical protein